MPTYALLPEPKAQFLDGSGNPLAGGKIYSYIAGTVTPVATYTDSSGSTPNANPVILDAAGRADIWVNSTQAYKIVAKNAVDVTQWTVDNITDAGQIIRRDLLDSATVGNGDALIAYKEPVGSGTLARTVHDRFTDLSFSVLDFSGVDKTGAANSDAGVVNAVAAAWAANAVLRFPAGTYRFASTVDFSFEGLRLLFENQVVFNCTGTVTQCVKIDGGVGASKHSIVIEGNGWIINGNANAQDGLWLRNVTHARINCPRVRNVSRYAFNIEGAVLCDFRNPKSSLNVDAMTTVPTRGLYVHTSALFSSTTACTFHNAIFEGMAGEGVYLEDTAACLFLGGTSEGNTTANGVGVRQISSSTLNSFHNFFMESNTGGDIIDGGSRNSYTGGAANSSGTSITVGATAIGVKFEGFQAKGATVLAGALDTWFIRMNVLDTAIIDGGTRTQYLATRQLFLSTNYQTQWQPGNISSGDARVLDWYQEGVFTPSFGGSGGDGSITYSEQTGRYTRIGNRVYFDIYILVNVLTTAPTGTLLVRGLPHVAGGGSRSSFVASYWRIIDLSAGYTQVGGQIIAGDAFLTMIESGDAVGYQAILGGALSGTAVIQVSGHYEVAG